MLMKSKTCDALTQLVSQCEGVGGGTNVRTNSSRKQRTETQLKVSSRNQWYPNQDNDAENRKVNETDMQADLNLNLM